MAHILYAFEHHTSELIKLVDAYNLKNHSKYAIIVDIILELESEIEYIKQSEKEEQNARKEKDVY